MHNRIDSSLLVILITLIVTACDSSTKQEMHVVKDNGTEWGVEIEVVLKNGGSATLVCPKFTGKPVGAHGRECYLREYDKG